MIIDTGGLSPEEWSKTPQGRAAAARPPLAPPPRRLPEPLSPSAPARPAAPNPNSKESVYRTLHQELLRMYPDRSPAELSQMARQLADEFIAERNQALDDMAKGPPGPTTLEGSGLPANYQGEWRWDGNKIVPVDQNYLDGQQRVRERTAAERDSRVARQENIASQRGNNRSRVGYPERRLQPVFGMAQETPPQSTGTPYGQTSRSEQQNRDILAKSRGYESTEDFMQKRQAQGMRQARGMAESIQPKSQGTPYGAPSEDEMYWELVNSGVPPAEAARRMREAFQYAPRRPQSQPAGFPQSPSAPHRGLAITPSDWGSGAGYAQKVAEAARARSGLGPAGAAVRAGIAGSRTPT